MSIVDLRDLDPNMDESLLDMRISWRYFKKYAKTLVGFIFAGYIFAFLIQILLTIVVFRLFEINNGEDTILQIETIQNISYILVIPFVIFSFAYFGSIYGMAYDLISSGEEYTRFSGSFIYFKRYGWQYIIIEVIKSIPTILLIILLLPENPEFSEMNLGNLLIIIIFTSIWFILFVMTLPSVTAQGSVKKSFIENFKIIKANPKRIFKTFGLFFLFFELPIYIIIYFQSYLPADFNTLNQIIYSIILGIVVMGIAAIANPMAALLSTRIYNTSESSYKNPQDLQKNGKNEPVGINPDF